MYMIHENMFILCALKASLLIFYDSKIKLDDSHRSIDYSIIFLSKHINSDSQCLSQRQIENIKFYSISSIHFLYFYCIAKLQIVKIHTYIILGHLIT